MLKNVVVHTASESELDDAQRFYDSRGYGGAAINPLDIVILAKHASKIVGIGRLCHESNFICLRGMQILPEFQRQGIGSRILKSLEHELGQRPCYCLPYAHLLNFYGQAGFRHVASDLPPILDQRLAGYTDRGLSVIAMIRNSQGTV